MAARPGPRGNVVGDNVCYVPGESNGGGAILLGVVYAMWRHLTVARIALRTTEFRPRALDTTEGPRCCASRNRFRSCAFATDCGSTLNSRFPLQGRLLPLNNLSRRFALLVFSSSAKLEVRNTRAPPPSRPMYLRFPLFLISAISHVTQIPTLPPFYSDAKRPRPTENCNKSCQRSTRKCPCRWVRPLRKIISLFSRSEVAGGVTADTPEIRFSRKKTGDARRNAYDSGSRVLEMMHGHLPSLGGGNMGTGEVGTKQLPHPKDARRTNSHPNHTLLLGHRNSSNLLEGLTKRRQASRGNYSGELLRGPFQICIYPVRDKASGRF